MQDHTPNDSPASTSSIVSSYGLDMNKDCDRLMMLEELTGYDIEPAQLCEGLRLAKNRLGRPPTMRQLSGIMLREILRPAAAGSLSSLSPLRQGMACLHGGASPSPLRKQGASSDDDREETDQDPETSSYPMPSWSPSGGADMSPSRSPVQQRYRAGQGLKCPSSVPSLRLGGGPKTMASMPVLRLGCKAMTSMVCVYLVCSLS